MTVHSKSFYEPCIKVLHNIQDPSRAHPNICNREALAILIAAFKAASRIYVPLFVLSAVITRKITSPQFIIKKLIPSIIRSSLFVGVVGAMWHRGACLGREITGGNHPAIYFISPFIAATVGIWVEKPERRNEITIFIIQQATQAVFNMAVGRNWIRPIRHGLTFLFALSFGILLYFHQKDENCLGGSTRSLMKVAVGTDAKPDILERKLSQAYIWLKKTLFHGEATIEDQPKDRRCNHFHSCKSHALVGFGRSFLLGFTIRSCFALLPLLLKPTKLMKKSPRIFTDRDILSLGVFLGLLSGGNRAIQCLLRRIRGVEDGWNQLIAGFVVGWSFVLNGSIEVGMYVLSKAAEAVYRWLVKMRAIKPIWMGDKFLFSLATAIMFYCSMWEPHHVRFSYFKFLVKASGNRYGRCVKAFAPVREDCGIPGLSEYLQWKERVTPFLKNV